MSKGLVAFMAGLVVSLLFGVGFMYLQPKQYHEEMTVYYLQTGVYQTKENALKMQTTLKGLQIENNMYEQASMYYVICGISSSLEDLGNIKEVLNQQSMSFVQKEATVSATDDKQEMTRFLLEYLENENPTNG